MNPKLPMFSYPTGHLCIRPLGLADAVTFLELGRVSSPHLLPWLQLPTEMIDFERLIARQADETLVALGLWNLQTQQLVGQINLSQIFHGGFQNAYLSYWIGNEFRGRGWMREGLRLTLHYAFDQLHLHRLEANIQPGNQRSIALVQAVGFVKEGYSEKYLQVLGEWRDHERWAIHREIWLEKDLEPHLRPRFA